MVSFQPAPTDCSLYDSYQGLTTCPVFGYHFTLQYEPAPLPSDATTPEDRHESWNLPNRSTEPYMRVTQKVSAQQWQSDEKRYEQRLLEALHNQQFRNIQINFDGSSRLSISLSNEFIHPASRAVGRAVRTALPHTPLETQTIRISYTETSALFKTDPHPLVTYDFNDLPRLQRYLDGEIESSELADSVTVNYLTPSARQSNPLALLNEIEPVESPSLMDTLLPDSNPIYRVKNDFVNAASHTAETSWFKAGAMGADLALSMVTDTHNRQARAGFEVLRHKF